MKKLPKIDRIAAAAKTMGVLAHPVRMKITEFLADGEKNVGTIQKHIKQEQTVISKHLRLLLENDLVNRRREMHYIYYRQNKKVIEGIDKLINEIS